MQKRVSFLRGAGVGLCPKRTAAPFQPPPPAFTPSLGHVVPLFAIDFPMKKYALKRLLCLLLCLLLSGCGETVPASIHGEASFSQMELSGESGAGLSAQIGALEQYVRQGGEEEIALNRYAALTESYNRLKGDEALLYVYRCRNMADENAAESYERLCEETSEAEYRLTDLELVLLDAYPEAFKEGYGEEVRRRDGLNGVHAQPLFQQERALCQEYEALRTGLKVEYGGRLWGYRELMEDDTLSFREFFAAVELYEKAFYAQAGEIYLKLLQVRKKLASVLGFASYEAYAYARFGREYGKEEVESWEQEVKSNLAPLYVKYRRALDGELEYLADGTFSEEAALENISAALKESLPVGAEAWGYMHRLGLYDSEASPQKLRGSFTTYLPAYHAPYLFTQWEGKADSLFTVLHEFGHFLSFYVNPEGVCYGGSLDTAEADSQGLELLLFNQYGTLFGEYAAAAQISALLDGLYGVLVGFMEDEFQRKAFEMDAPTVEKLNGLYLSLTREYGLLEIFTYTGREWMDIGHTFSFPFYYISYGVSMLGALKLWRMEQGSRGRGWAAYKGLLARQGDWDFFETMRRCHLGNPLSKKEIERTAAAVDRALQKAGGQN